MRTPYCTVLDIENYMLTEIDESFEPQVETWIKAISNEMDKMANRKLVADTIGSGEDEYEDKYFDGNGKQYLYIDDFVDLDSVSLDEVEMSSVEAYPKIAPHKAIYSQSGAFSRGIQNIKVTARWGLFEEVPEDIRLACSILVSGIINASYKKLGKKSEKIGNYQVTYEEDKGMRDFEQAKAIIASYRKIEI